ncbi:hypothetical protein SSAG_00677 [Streptomyces sp. Mg1]|nr:hypothetical protein SSAG_00677 [Streptomyces sp. Mg1]
MRGMSAAEGRPRAGGRSKPSLRRTSRPAECSRTPDPHHRFFPFTPVTCTERAPGPKSDVVWIRWQRDPSLAIMGPLSL